MVYAKVLCAQYRKSKNITKVFPRVIEYLFPIAVFLVLILYAF